MNEDRRGLLAGTSAFLLWGLAPLFWPLLRPSSATEILAHRFVWSLVFVLLLTAAQRRTGSLRVLLRDRRTVVMLVGASVLIAINWYTYIFGVLTGHVVETSLGYFINPLVTVLIGVLVLRERLRATQWVAVGVATVAVLVLAVDYGRPPWIALVLAFSFAAYGLIKKTAAAGAIEGMAVESGALLLPSLAYLVVLQANGTGTFGHEGGGHAVLVASAGAVTAIPLLLFAAAARRVPLVTIGLLQYLAPVVQFVLGVVVFDEEMPTVRWIGFALVWIALVLFTSDQVAAGRRRRRDVADLRPAATA